MKQFLRGAILALSAVLVVAEKAPAGVLEYGMGARGVAMGQAQVAAANDASAMTYNPAALAYARDYWDLRTRMNFIQVSSIGVDSKLYLNGVEQMDPYTAAFVFGSVIPLTRRLTMGMQVYYPSDTTIELEFFRGATIPRYRAWRWFYVIAGGCYQLTRKLSFGGAANFTLNFNSSTLNLDIANLASVLGLKLTGTKNLNPAFKIDVLLKQSYELGGLYRPTKWLNIGAFYRYKLGTEFNIPVKIPAGLTPEETDLLISGYMYVINPPQWAFGVAVFPTKNLTMAFDMQYDEWSKIKPGIVISSNSPAFSAPKEHFELKDVWWPKFGVEWKDRAGGKYSRVDYAVRLGYSYYPSPYPEKVPLSGNIDNSAHYFSGGFSVGYKPRRTLRYVSMDYFYQYADLVERKHEDITKNPSTIVSSGHVIYTGFGLTMMM